VNHGKRLSVAALKPDTAKGPAQIKPNIVVVHGSENYLFSPIHNVRRATYPQWPSIEHVGIDHGGAYVLMTKKFLDRPNVLAPLQ
jgi:hypothetical protein